jgi:hypothetical protein
MYLKSIKPITGKLITFDFDGTLEDEFDGSINSQKEEVQNICKQLIQMGNDVRILTKRYSDEHDNLGKGNEHTIVYQLASQLGIPKSSVHFTNREMKFEFVIQNKVDIHFENAQYEVDLIYQAADQVNHKCVVVPVEDSYWRDLVY